MSTILENLKRFNRKERFYLLGKALGNPDFQLGKEFRTDVGSKFGLTIPANAFVAMDYHIDWIYASLSLASHQDHKGEAHGETIFDNKSGEIKANQQDVDLLIAFADDNDPAQTHLILLEAKMDTSWSNKQLESKTTRFQKIFSGAFMEQMNVVPHFAILSPREPQKIASKDFPGWMLSNGSLLWLELPMPDNLCKVTRCNGNGTPDKDGRNWTVQNR